MKSTEKQQDSCLSTTFGYTSQLADLTKWNAGQLRLRMYIQEASSDEWKPLEIYKPEVYGVTYQHKNSACSYNVATAYVCSKSHACFAIELDYLSLEGQPRKKWGLQEDQHLELEISIDQCDTPDSTTGKIDTPYITLSAITASPPASFSRLCLR